MSHLLINLADALNRHGPLDIHMAQANGRTRVVITGSHGVVDLTSVVALHAADALGNALAELNQ